MTLEWEEEHILHMTADVPGPNVIREWHLKRILPRPDSPRPYKVSVAWVYREGDRKFDARVIAGAIHDEVRYDAQKFRSLKQAKAWCLAVYTLEQ